MQACVYTRGRQSRRDATGCLLGSSMNVRILFVSFFVLSAPRRSCFKSHTLAPDLVEVRRVPRCFFLALSGVEFRFGADHRTCSFYCSASALSTKHYIFTPGLLT